MRRHLLGMSEVGFHRCVNLDVHRVSRSRLDTGAAALLSVEIPNVVTTTALRLYRNGRTGEPFVSGPPRIADDGRIRRSPLTAYGEMQHACTTLAYGLLKEEVLDECDPLEVADEDRWLTDELFAERFKALSRNDAISLDVIERVDRLREAPNRRGTWLFRLTIAGAKIGDGLVIEDCVASDLDAPWPIVMAPQLPRSDERYATINPESARRIAQLIRGKVGSDAPFRETATR